MSIKGSITQIGLNIPRMEISLSGKIKKVSTYLHILGTKHLNLCTAANIKRSRRNAHVACLPPEPFDGAFLLLLVQRTPGEERFCIQVYLQIAVGLSAIFCNIFCGVVDGLFSVHIISPLSPIRRIERLHHKQFLFIRVSF